MKGDKHIDPVCGMTVEEGREAGKSEYQGKEYYFCSRGCKVKFDKDPEKVLKEGPKGMM
jgi:YHS domain-containing protein